MTKRRKYSPEFKREAVLLTQQPGVSCRQIALDTHKINTLRDITTHGYILEECLAH